MEQHSDVDLSDKTIVLHVDYPIYEDTARTEAARKNIDAQVEAFQSSEAAMGKLASGDLKIVETETDMRSWNGKFLEAEEARLAA